MIKTYVIDIDPIPKPRLTQRDRWKQRPVVNRWNAFKDEFRLKCNLQGLTSLPDAILSETFIIPMPLSWSDKKKKGMDGKPHQQTPDLDNLEKAIFDILCPDGDSHIWHTGERMKIWGKVGKIIINC